MKWKTLSSGSLLALVLNLGIGANPAEPSRPWPVYGGDFAGSKHSGSAPR
jgi:hypothetical protein